MRRVHHYRAEQYAVAITLQARGGHDMAIVLGDEEVVARTRSDRPSSGSPAEVSNSLTPSRSPTRAARIAALTVAAPASLPARKPP